MVSVKLHSRCLHFQLLTQQNSCFADAPDIGSLAEVDILKIKVRFIWFCPNLTDRKPSGRQLLVLVGEGTVHPVVKDAAEV